MNNTNNLPGFIVEFENHTQPTHKDYSVVPQANRPLIGKQAIWTRSLKVARFDVAEDCNGVLCTCSGSECDDMFSSLGPCGSLAGCDERGCWCLTI